MPGVKGLNALTLKKLKGLVQIWILHQTKPWHSYLILRDTPYLGSATGGHKIVSLVSLPAAEQGGASVFWKTYDSSLALSGV
jgi:hypothetical protein